MIFNNRNINTFPHTKATKFDTSYYADFQRQEIVSRGLLRSFVEVPTVRKIVVSIVTRGKSKEALDERIREIVKWLYASGTERLQTDRDPQHYYLARCTGVSTPKFSGLTATFDATFTCPDYRPRDVRTAQPVTDATIDLTNFTFAGKHCLNDMNCLFVLESLSATPKIKRHAYEITGTSGTLRFDDGLPVLQEKQLSGSLYFLKDTKSTSLMSAQEIIDRTHAVSAWLVNAKRSHLILDNDASRYYEAEVIDQSDLSFDKWANGMVKLKFTLQPMAYDVDVTTKTVNLSGSGWKTIDLADVASDLECETPLAIRVTNTSSNTISDIRIKFYKDDNSENTLTISENGFSVGNYEVLEVNSLDYEVFVDQRNVIQSVGAGDFPVITPSGTKAIGLYCGTSATLQVTVEMRKRWL